jgi:hypothetical protein
MSQEEIDLLNHIDAVWEHYFLTQHPSALANYLELGGEIDADVRIAIITRLREGPPKNKGSRDNLRDVDVYMAIEDIRFQRTIEIVAPGPCSQIDISQDATTHNHIGYACA